MNVKKDAIEKSNLKSFDLFWWSSPIVRCHVHCATRTLNPIKLYPGFRSQNDHPLYRLWCLFGIQLHLPNTHITKFRTTQPRNQVVKLLPSSPAPSWALLDMGARIITVIIVTTNAVNKIPAPVSPYFLYLEYCKNEIISSRKICFKNQLHTGASKSRFANWGWFSALKAKYWNK